MIVSVLFLLTGIYLAMNTGNKGNWLWVKLIAVFAAIPIAIVAFKKSNKILALLSFLLICYAYGISETKNAAMKKQAPDPGEFANIATPAVGKTIYESKCTNCHGTDGKMGMSGAKDLTQYAMTPEQKLAIVKTGKNVMPSFSSQLTEEQIKAVADYVKH